MKNNSSTRQSQKTVILQRFTHFSSVPEMIHGMLTGNVKNIPESIWVALTIDTQKVIGENVSKENLLQELSQKNYIVKKIVNEWN